MVRIDFHISAARVYGTRLRKASFENRRHRALETMSSCGCRKKSAEQGIFTDNLGKVHAAACPKCGYLEFYLEDTAKLNN